MRSRVKIILWGVFGLLVLLWTALVAISVEIVQWSSAALAAGGVSGLAEAAASLPIPAWLAPFLDLSGWRETLATLAAWIESLSALLPSLGQSLSWLVPVIWVVWGMGTLTLLVLTLLASRLIRF